MVARLKTQFLLFVAALITMTIVTLALTQPSEAKNTKQKINKTLGTNFNFEDLTVKGRYQYADEAAAVVETEKDIDDLLQPRKHFKDRLNQSASRQ